MSFRKLPPTIPTLVVIFFPPLESSQDIYCPDSLALLEWVSSGLAYPSGSWIRLVNPRPRTPRSLDSTQQQYSRNQAIIS